MIRRWKEIALTLVLMAPLMASGQNKAETNTSLLGDTLVYTVYGMDCPGCERGLEKQVNKIPAVTSSDASWVDQRLEVIVMKDSVINLKELENRVKKANFTLETKKNDL